jgi:mannose-1-phosphate guanylyltransferase
MQISLDRKKCTRGVIILAGGDGNHFHESTKVITQHCIPKQFCTLAGHETLLEQTLHRVACLAPPQATAIVVNRTHHQFYHRLAGVPEPCIVAQPSDRGTVPAILCGLRRLANLGRNTIVAVFPCDRRLMGNKRFIHHVEEAMVAVEASPSLSIALGVIPTTADSSF